MKKTTEIVRTLCFLCALVASILVLSSCKSTPADTGNTQSIGERADGILTVYVANDGQADADGTKEKPFASIEGARDAIRSVDKTDLKGIDVIVLPKKDNEIYVRYINSESGSYFRNLKKQIIETIDICNDNIIKKSDEILDTIKIIANFEIVSIISKACSCSL